MKSPQWLERLRQLSDPAKKRILIAFLAISIVVVILPLALVQGRKSYKAAVADPSIQKLKADMSSEIEKYNKTQEALKAEQEKMKKDTGDLVFGEGYVPPLKSTLDHNVSVAINASSQQIGSFLVLDLSLLNFGKINVHFDPTAIRVIQDGKETAPLATGEWSPDIVALNKTALGTTLEPALVMNGIVVFPTKGPSFNLSVPGMKADGSDSTWDYTFSAVTLNPPKEKQTP